MAGCAEVIALLCCHGFCPDDPELRERLPLRSFLRDQNMLLRRTVACLAVDAGLCPGCMVGLCPGVIVAPDLAHVAVVARGIECICALSPVNRRVRPLLTREMPEPAPGCIEPFFFCNIIRYREGLEPALVKRREEIVDVLPACYVYDPVFLRPLRPGFRYISGCPADVGAVFVFPDNDVPLLGREFFLREF